MSFKAKDAAVEARALEAQTIHAIIDISTTAAVIADCPSVTASGAILTKAVVLDVGEPVLKCLAVKAVNRATGAVVVANSAPVVSGNTITVSLVGTSVSSCHVEFIYIVA